MKKLNSVIYNKLSLQAEEAKLRGMTKLASHVFNAIGSVPEDEKIEYSREQVLEDVKEDLWKAATNVLKYHNVESINVENLEYGIKQLAASLINQIDVAIGAVDEKWLSPLEPLVPGEERKS